jgi:hypothetical protein
MMSVQIDVRRYSAFLLVVASENSAPSSTIVMLPFFQFPTPYILIRNPQHNHK